MSLPSSQSLSGDSLKPARKLNLLLQHSPLAMIEWDSEQVVTAWNPAAAKLFNFFEDEAIGQKLEHLLAQRQLTDLGTNSWMSCAPAGIVSEHITVSGKKLCRWFNTPFMVQGQQVGTLSTIVETTRQTALSNEELRSQLQSRTRVLKHTTARLQSAMSDRAQTHAALQESETRFQNLAANVPGVLYQLCVQADGSIAIPYISNACQSVYELSAEAIQTNPTLLLAMIDSEDRLALEATMQQSIKMLTPWNSEHKITTPSGQLKWVQMASQPQLEDNGGTLWSGVIIDITARKEAEHQKQAAHTFLHNLINGISDPIFVKDENHSLILLNDAFCEFVGRSRNEIVGHKELALVSEQETNQIWQTDDHIDDHVLGSGQSSTTEESFSNASGQLKYISTTKTRFRALNGKPYLLGIIRDLTEKTIAQKALTENEKRLLKQTQQLQEALTQLKRTQTKLIQSEKMSSLGQLVAGIAHEINNPVNFIHGNITHAQDYIRDMLQVLRLYQAHYPTPIKEIQAISDDLELDYVLHDLPKLLNSVQLGTQRIRQIVLSLRNFSRLDESELKQANIQEGLESTLMILSSRLGATASRHAIEVVKAYENIPMVECYASQLNQVFLNILTNAIDAIDGDPVPDKIYQIVLQTFLKNEQVTIRVTNNGPPIPHQEGPRIFDPFFTTKPVGQGTGMGLAISYQTIVDLHKGSLEYTQTEDHKTVFTLTIPVTPAP
ncbi:MAG: PAS domain S-box protein [Cyanobacteria bacterium P01_F01_bin.53]